MPALVDRLLQLFERLANRRTGKLKIAGNRADALTPPKKWRRLISAMNSICITPGYSSKNAGYLHNSGVEKIQR